MLAPCFFLQDETKASGSFSKDRSSQQFTLSMARIAYKYIHSLLCILVRAPKCKATTGRPTQGTRPALLRPTRGVKLGTNLLQILTWGWCLRWAMDLSRLGVGGIQNFGPRQWDRGCSSTVATEYTGSTFRTPDGGGTTALPFLVSFNSAHAFPATVTIKWCVPLPVWLPHASKQ